MTDLEALGVTRRYGATMALQGVSARFRPAAITCVLGASGSGKSTLLRQLHLLEAPDEGEVRLDGNRAPVSGPRWISALRRFSLVQQGPGLLRSSATRNVAFPLRARGVPRDAADEIARQWLGRVGLEGREEAHPDELSGGEAQRVAVARALVTKPDILLVDEGTNQLDPHAARRVEKLIRDQAMRGCTIVLVTHNVPQALRLADDFVFLEGGRVLEAGTKEELRSPGTEGLRLFLEMG